MKKTLLLFLSVIVVCISIASCVNSPQAIIQAEATAANLQCPQDMGNGMTLTKVEFEGLYVVNYIKGSDDIYSFSQELVTDEMKNQIVQALKQQAQSQPQVKKYIEAMKKENVGIIYHYSTSNSVMDVVIESRDL